MKARLLSFLFAVMLIPTVTLADGLIIVRNPPPRPFPSPHPVFAPLEVAYHQVDVTIDGQQATTKVDQEFFNPNGATLEGEYLFPIPAGAHIDKFTMRVGDKDLEAELLDAAKARSIYEEIVRQQRDPALLEYTGRPAFRVRIFPIEPRSRKRVQLTYTELLKADGGMVSYLYPLNTEKFSAQPLQRAAIRLRLEQTSPLKALYSPSHQVEIKRDGDRRATVGWETTNARPDRDFQLLFSTAESEVGLNLLTQKKEGEDGWFTLLAAPGAEAVKTAGEPQAKDLVFVLDTSGSMAGKKLEQAKKALSFCVENLNDVDRFEVLHFATETEPCFEKLADAGKASREKALKWIDGLRPIGGTAIHEALQRALALRPASNERPFIVIFLTDGQPTVGETNEDRIVATASPAGGAPTRVFSFGIGTDVNTHLLDKIAERTRAATQFVLPEEDLEVKLSAFFTKIKEPLLTNIKLSWPEGVRVSKLYPAPLPDLFRGDQLILTGRYSGAGEGDIVLEGLVNGQPRRLTQRVKFPEIASGHDFIPQLWALRRVGFLLDEVRLRGENTELRDEIVDLARRYAIVTPYTSYLIVEDEARRGVPLTLQTLPAQGPGSPLQSVLREGWDGLKKEKAGDTGAFNARSNKAFKDADVFDGAITANTSESKRAIAAAKPAESSALSRADGDGSGAKNQSPARVVNGRAFYQNGNQWTDTTIQRQANARRQQIKFASEEYFRLLTENRDLAPWLALGRNVQFEFGGTLYEVTE